MNDEMYTRNDVRVDKKSRFKKEKKTNSVFLIVTVCI